jgi:hypothetical protein
MTTSSYAFDHDLELDDSATDARIRDRRSNDFNTRRQSRPKLNKSRRGPSQVNGIHRRRNKRLAW